MPNGHELVRVVNSETLLWSSVKEQENRVAIEHTFVDQGVTWFCTIVPVPFAICQQDWAQLSKKADQHT